MGVRLLPGGEGISGIGELRQHDQGRTVVGGLADQLQGPLKVLALVLQTDLRIELDGGDPYGAGGRGGNVGHLRGAFRSGWGTGVCGGYGGVGAIGCGGAGRLLVEPFRGAQQQALAARRGDELEADGQAVDQSGQVCSGRAVRRRSRRWSGRAARRGHPPVGPPRPWCGRPGAGPGRAPRAGRAGRSGAVAPGWRRGPAACTSCASPYSEVTTRAAPWSRASTSSSYRPGAVTIRSAWMAYTSALCRVAYECRSSASGTTASSSRPPARRRRVSAAARLMRDTASSVGKKASGASHPILSCPLGPRSCGASWTSAASACHSSRQSAGVRAMGPTVSREGDTGWTPRVDTASTVGFSPTTPQHDAGMRTEPPVSVPTARDDPGGDGHRRSAAGAAGRPVGPVGIARRAVGRAAPVGPVGELVGRRLADDDRARLGAARVHTRHPARAHGWRSGVTPWSCAAPRCPRRP